MMQPDAIPIPYERQRSSRTDRTCGAAALSMAIRSLGVSCRQEDIWERVARGARDGTRAASTYLLAADALRHGLTAVCFEASRPWPVLERCVAGGVRAVLSHRLRRGSPLGHYTVLAGVGPEYALLHDPQRGPAQRLEKEDLLELWRGAADSEIAGHVLVAIGPAESTDGSGASCEVCGAGLPRSIACPRCANGVLLRPAVALGCMAEGCPGRLWTQVFCPRCDASIPFGAGLPTPP